MKNISPEKLIIIASYISLEITKDKSIEEINAIKVMFNLICSNLQAYTSQKIFYSQNLSKNDKG